MDCDNPKALSSHCKAGKNEFSHLRLLRVNTFLSKEFVLKNGDLLNKRYSSALKKDGEDSLRSPTPVQQIFTKIVLFLFFFLTTQQSVCLSHLRHVTCVYTVHRTAIYNLQVDYVQNTFSIWNECFEAHQRRMKRAFRFF